MIGEAAGATAVFLANERVALREMGVADVTDAYHAWINDPEVTRFLEARFFPHSPDRLRDYVTRANADEATVLFAIVRQDTGAHIGTIKLGLINRIHRSAEVALMIGDTASWGRGYGTDAIALVVEYGFEILNLKKLTAGVYGNNVGSIRAFLKAGFREEARRPQHFYSDGAWVDHVWLGLVNERS